jgi:hypothetical protein
VTQVCSDEAGVARLLAQPGRGGAAERMGGYVLFDPGSVGCAADDPGEAARQLRRHARSEERLRQDRLGEPLALHTNEERRLRIAGANPQVVDEERLEGRVDRHDSLPPALRPPDLEQAALEVDVLPVEPEQLAPTEPGLEERKQEPVVLALTVVASLPDVLALCRIEQADKLAAVEDVRQRLALFRRAEHLRRVAVELLIFEQEAEEALERGDGARLARRRGTPDRLVGEEAAQVQGRTSPTVTSPSRSRNATQVPTSRS